MESKFGRLKSFVDSLELDVLDSNEQAFLLVGGSGGGSGAPNNGCTNSSDCRGSYNNGCTNSSVC